jgi:hypothetical protein
MWFASLYFLLILLLDVTDLVLVVIFSDYQKWFVRWYQMWLVAGGTSCDCSLTPAVIGRGYYPWLVAGTSCDCFLLPAMIVCWYQPWLVAGGTSCDWSPVPDAINSLGPQMWSVWNGSSGPICPDKAWRAGHHCILIIAVGPVFCTHLNKQWVNQLRQCASPVKWVGYIEYQSFYTVLLFGATHPLPPKASVGELYIQGVERQRGEPFRTGKGVGGPKSYDSTATLVL